MNRLSRMLHGTSSRGARFAAAVTMLLAVGSGVPASASPVRARQRVQLADARSAPARSSRAKPVRTASTTVTPVRWSASVTSYWPAGAQDVQVVLHVGASTLVVWGIADGARVAWAYEAAVSERDALIARISSSLGQAVITVRDGSWTLFQGVGGAPGGPPGPSPGTLTWAVGIAAYLHGAAHAPPGLQP